MVFPGFTAEQSLQAVSVTYRHSAANVGGNYVAPVFLDVVAEAADGLVEGIEGVVGALSSAAQTACSAVASAFQNFGNDVPQGVQTWSCNQFFTAWMVCNGSSPAQSQADMALQCVQTFASDDPEFVIACAPLAAAIYGLAVLYCQNPSQGITPYLQQACPGS